MYGLLCRIARLPLRPMIVVPRADIEGYRGEAREPPRKLAPRALRARWLAHSEEAW